MTPGVWLVMGLVAAGALLKLARHLQQRGVTATITGLSPRAPMPETGRITHGLEQSPWAVLAAQEGWPLRTSVMMGAVGRLDITLPEGASLSVSGHAGAPPGQTAHLTLLLPTADPGQALKDRVTLAGLLTGMGRPLDPAQAQTWLPSLPGPQSLSYLRGNLTLALPLHIGQLDHALAGLRDLARALELAQHPHWAALSVARSWPLTTSSTGLTLLAQREGHQIVARLQGQPEQRRTSLRWRCPAGVPPMTLSHRDHGFGEPEAVPHLIANTVLHIRALDPDALGTHLQDDALFQAVLAVVHAYPGSTLTQERVELLAAGDLGEDLDQALERVAALAKALEAHSWSG